MPFYTFFGIKPGNTGSRIAFSTGRDMVLGEQLDLTAQEVIEVARVANHYDIRSGQLVVTITHLNFPAAHRYVRSSDGSAVSKKI